jgi:hypothetical protein
MTKRFSILLIVLTIVSGLIGGAITGRIFTPKVAIAEEATQSKVLTVEELRVVDKDGKELMILGKNDTNYGLTIFDKNGRVIAAICTEKSGESNGIVIVSDKDGGGTASMDVSERGGTINVFGKDGRASMRIWEYGGGVDVFSKDSGGTASMGVSERGGTINVFGKDGRASMRIWEYGGGVDVFSKDSKSGGATMNVNEYGGNIAIFNKDGKGGASMNIMGTGGVIGEAGAMMSARESGGSVSIYDKDGKNRASMDIDENGGVIGVSGRDGEPRAIIGVNEYGNGCVNIWDKNGYRLK